jgi:hypothetical protein
MTPTKQKIIDEIIIEIESGKSYTEIVAVICGKFRFSERTFDKYWKEANEQYKVIQDKRRVITESLTIQAHIEAVESAIMSREEKLKILESIIKGTVQDEKVFFDKGVPKKVPVSPYVVDKMKAIEIHNKMQGDNSPDETKVMMVEQPLFPDVIK